MDQLHRRSYAIVAYFDFYTFWVMYMRWKPVSLALFWSCLHIEIVQVKLLQSAQIQVSILAKIYLSYSRVSREIRDYNTEKSCILINRTVLQSRIRQLLQP